MERESINTVVLAGGFGVRTENALGGVPKALVPVGKSTVIDYLLDDLDEITRNVALVTNGKYFDILKAKIDSRGPVLNIIVLSNEQTLAEKRLGALGDLIFALGKLAWWKRDLLVVPSDTLYYKSFVLKDLVGLADKYPKSLITVARDIKDREKIKGRFGCILLGSDNKMIAFIEKPQEPPSTFAATPFYLYRAPHLEFLRKFKRNGGNLDQPGNIIPYLLEAGVDIRVLIGKNKIIDVGTPEDIISARNY